MQNKVYTNAKAADCTLQLEVIKRHIYEIKIVYSEKYDG